MLPTLTGCVSLATVSAGPTGCSPSDITILDDSDNYYTGQGSWIAVCRGRRHQCSRLGPSVSCTAEESSVGAAPRWDAPRTPPRASESRRDEIAAALRPATPAVLACFPGVQRVDLYLHVSARGRVDYFTAPRALVRDERRCLLRAMTGRSAPQADEPASARVRFEGGTRATLVNGSTQVTRATASAGAGENPEVRTLLDTQREAILACAERATVVVVVRWDASGAVTLALGGDLAGSSNEGCVRSALGAQHVAASAPGELRHLVR